MFERRESDFIAEKINAVRSSGVLCYARVVEAYLGGFGGVHLLAVATHFVRSSCSGNTC
jgi:hypothetical protein